MSGTKELNIEKGKKQQRLRHFVIDMLSKSFDNSSEPSIGTKKFLPSLPSYMVKGNLPIIALVLLSLMPLPVQCDCSWGDFACQHKWEPKESRSFQGFGSPTAAGGQAYAAQYNYERQQANRNQGLPIEAKYDYGLPANRGWAPRQF